MNNIQFTEVQNERDGQVFYDFHRFEKEKEFTGPYMSKYEYKGATPEDSWTALRFKNMQGETFLIAASHQIVEAIKKHGRAIYRIRFLGVKDIGKGRTVNQFKISTAPVPDEMQKWYDEKPLENAKPESKIADDLPF